MVRVTGLKWSDRTKERGNVRIQQRLIFRGQIRERRHGGAAGRVAVENAVAAGHHGEVSGHAVPAGRGKALEDDSVHGGTRNTGVTHVKGADQYAVRADIVVSGDLLWGAPIDVGGAGECREQRRGKKNQACAKAYDKCRVIGNYHRNSSYVLNQKNTRLSSF